MTQKYNQIVKQAKNSAYTSGQIGLAVYEGLYIEMRICNMQRVVPMEADDPRRIAPSIAVVPPPPSHLLFIQRSSRLKK